MAALAYWADVNPATLTALTGLVVGVGGLATQYLMNSWTNKRELKSGTAQAAETAQEGIDRRNRELWLRIEAERDYFKKRLEEESLANEHLQDETDAAKRATRGMEEFAHYFRHYALNTAQRFRSLFRLFEQYVEGELTHERAKLNLQEIEASLPTAPVPVPSLREVLTSHPPEG